jgi:hypothetical protein
MSRVYRLQSGVEPLSTSQYQAPPTLPFCYKVRVDRLIYIQARTLPHTHARTHTCQRPPSILRPQDCTAHPHHLPKDRRSPGVDLDALTVQRAA